MSERTVKANDVLKEVQVALANANTNEQKDLAFKELMYKYNEDGGIMNAAYPYVLGVANSKMVESFTDASRELNTAGVYGGVSGLVESEYGEDANPLYERLAKYFQILDSYGFVHWKK